MAHTSVDQVALELGAATPAPGSTLARQWERWIDRVEGRIALRFRRAGFNLDSQVAEGNPSVDILAGLVASVVARQARNPEGLTSTTVSVDDGSITRRREGAAAGDGPGLILTETEWDEIMPAVQHDAFSSPIRYSPGW